MVDAAAPGTADALLQVVDRVVADLDRGRTAPRATLHSRLQRDLGLDSLALSELLDALEETFGVSLPTSALSTVETPDDLLRAVVAAGPRLVAPTAPAAAGPRPADRGIRTGRTAPADLATLVDVVDWYCATRPDRVHLWLRDDCGTEAPITYAGLRSSAERVAQGLIRSDVTPGQTVALMLPTSRGYFDAFLGVLLAGGVPVPIYPPARPSQIEDHLRRHITLLDNAQVGVLITVPEGRTVARVLRSSVATLRRVVTIEELSDAGGDEPLPRVAAGDTALIQYTSGSTGQPKGVVLSHAALLANIRAMEATAQVTPDDVFVSWLPLYHDMGLIGAWLGSLCSAMPAVVMTPQSFLSRPARWLEAVSAHGGTLTAAPNFAFELCLRRVTDAELATLDLSSLRMAMNGAEPVVAGTMQRFAERFAACGLRPEALAPVYGLAECGLGITFPPPGRGLVVDRIVADVLASDGRAVPARDGERDVLEVVACGSALPGYEVRVMDHGGRRLPDRREGEVELRGPSMTSGYYRNPDATDALFDGAWLRTGDLGYTVSGELHLTGRSKDLITAAGRNLHPEQLETEVGRIPGVRRGCVAVFGVPDPTTGTERLVVLAETHQTGHEELEWLRAQILDTTVDVLGTPAGDVVLAPPGTVLKTSSGKIRRSTCAERYRQGRTATRARPPWWQLVRVGARGVVPQLRRTSATVPTLAYSAWCWAVLLVLAVPLLAVITVAPRRGGGAARCGWRPGPCSA